MVILYSAPLPPEGRGNLGSPGAMRKITLTIQLLKYLGHSVILIDSSHLSETDIVFNPSEISERRFGEYTIKVIRPIITRNRKLGKAIQALQAPKIGSLAASLSEIDLILIYNAYLFEVRLARYFLRKQNIPYILQLEDLPWSRRRGLFNIKPAIEKLMFIKTCRDAAMILCVNSRVKQLTKLYNQNVELYPPIIDPYLQKLSSKRLAPFSGKTIKIGYFGGLNKEKGADMVLQLTERLDSRYKLYVAGKGDLAEEFSRYSKNKPDKLSFYGFVSNDKLTSLLCEMDILLNPHTDLQQLDEGVFPFKLFEYIASGSYVISTQLPGDEAKKLKELCYFDGSIKQLLQYIYNAKSAYTIESQKRLKDTAINLAGFSATAQRIAKAINHFC